MKTAFSFGGCCVNDTVFQLASPYLPFGGIGSSGMGQSHGKYGFLNFSHLRGEYQRFGRLESSLRYPPYSGKKLRKIEKMMNLF